MLQPYPSAHCRSEHRWAIRTAELVSSGGTNISFVLTAFAFYSALDGRTASIDGDCVAAI